jgi:hypothetical protein
VQNFRHIFLRGAHNRGLGKRGYFLADSLFERLKHRDVLDYLLLLPSELLDCTPNEGQVAGYRLELLL